MRRGLAKWLVGGGGGGGSSPSCWGWPPSTLCSSSPSLPSCRDYRHGAPCPAITRFEMLIWFTYLCISYIFVIYFFPPQFVLFLFSYRSLFSKDGVPSHFTLTNFDPVRSPVGRFSILLFLVVGADDYAHGDMCTDHRLWEIPYWFARLAVLPLSSAVEDTV